MDALLMVITLTSVLAAAGALLYAWQLSQETKARSAARVASLAADIEQTGPLEETFARVASDASAESSPGSLFAAPVEDAAPLRRLVPALLAGVVLVGGVAATVALSNGGTDAAAASSDATRSQPLELLSLRHETGNGLVTITGLVRNAAGNRDIDHVSAVVFLFDDKGGFLASGRAPLEFTTLAAGEESPFVVSLSTPAGVARYRVSFRRSEGGMVAHVDRREVKP